MTNNKLRACAIMKGDKPIMNMDVILTNDGEVYYLSTRRSKFRCISLYLSLFFSHSLLFFFCNQTSCDESGYFERSPCHDYLNNRIAKHMIVICIHI